MRYTIRVVGNIEDSDRPADEKFPNIVAVGESEHEAVGIFVVLYNANLLTVKSEDGTITNCTKHIWYTTFAVGLDTFNELQAYFSEVQGIELNMSLD